MGETEVKKSDCMKVINSLAGVATKEVKSAGFRDSRSLHGEDAPEAGHQGRQEGGLWQGYDGEGQARQDHREGLPGVRPEEEHLSAEPCVSRSSKSVGAPRAEPGQR